MTEYCLYLWFILFVENDGKLVLLKTKHKPAPTQLMCLALGTQWWVFQGEAQLAASPIH